MRTRMGIAFLAVIAMAGAGLGCTPAPQLPLSHQQPGYTSCLRCHSSGAGGAPLMPASHASYSDANNGASCLRCHK